MNALLVLLALAISMCVALAFPSEGPAAVVFCAVLTGGAAYLVSRHQTHARFLVQIFVFAVLLRVAVGSAIYHFGLQEFFGGDAFTYDYRGWALLEYWRGGIRQEAFDQYLGFYIYRNWGMPYLVAGVYWVVGRNMLAVQYVNAVVGAATAPVIFLCARQIFQNLRVAKVAALFVGFFPSLILWSSQGLKDGPIVFLLAAAMLATLRLGERLSAKYLAVLILALYGLLTLRFYVFYMTIAAVVSAFLIGMRPRKASSLMRQFAMMVVLGLSLTYMGVLRTATAQYETFGNLQAVQTSRADLAQSASSGFGQDVDVSTAGGALSAIPIGMTYLLFAPFPWQVANLRQSITLPEMLVWWLSFPLLVLGIWFTVKYRLRQALPILAFTTMLTLAYSIFQGNVGTAYRQRSQLLVFYFIFVAVGGVLLKERREERERARASARKNLAAVAGWRPPQPETAVPAVRGAPPPAAQRDVIEI